MKTFFIAPRYWLWMLVCLAPLLGWVAPSSAQTNLSLEDAILKALDTRASLKAEAERISAAEGLEKQAHAIANPLFEFENENLRPGQTYSRDVDTYAYVTQPLDILGKRKERIEVAGRGVNRAHADYELARRQQVIDGQKRYTVALRLPDRYRNDPSALGSILLRASGGEQVSLNEVAQIEVKRGPEKIEREEGQRRIVVMSNVRGRDLGSFVAEVRSVIEREISLPAGIFHRVWRPI